MPDNIDWDGLIAEVLQRGTDVPEVPWFKPGEDAAYDVSTADVPSRQTHLQDKDSRLSEGLILRRVQMVHTTHMQCICRTNHMESWAAYLTLLFIGFAHLSLEKLCYAAVLADTAATAS